jgi:hypothetical protein
MSIEAAATAATTATSGEKNPPSPRSGDMVAKKHNQIARTAEELPIYINPKKIHRILKRRVARKKLEEYLGVTTGGRKAYIHDTSECLSFLFGVRGNTYVTASQ